MMVLDANNLGLGEGGTETSYFTFSQPCIGLANYQPVQASRMMVNVVIGVWRLLNMPADWPSLVVDMHAVDDA